MRTFVPVLLALAGGCGFHSQGGAADQLPPDGEVGDSCTTIDDAAAVTIATAARADEHALRLTGRAMSATSWATAGNEALVLEVSGAGGRLIGHLVLHQGADEATYGMHVGALAVGEPIAVRVSTLSATAAVRKACVRGALVDATRLGADGEGLRNAPIFRWPVQKRFNDLPIVVGWSQAKQQYESVYTNEDGGTVAQCGGGAAGIQAEIGRWGRAADIEASYRYAGPVTWGRCTGPADATTTPLRSEASHPILYYGDGHNRLFESRAGYGQACGSGGAEKANGDLAGWNVSSPGPALADDDGRVVIVRPLPVALDPLGYATFPGRREALIDAYAPWLYRLTALELAREAKLDGSRALTMERYAYVDVRVADVGGSGDSYCSLTVSSGFKVRVITQAGAELSSGQVTASYVGAPHDWKRVAIALPAGVTAADLARVRFDAYDSDGIYLTAIGDVFVPQPAGANGATLAYARRGELALTQYVDDNYSGCAAGVTPGPGGATYTCTGSFVDVALTR